MRAVICLLYAPLSSLSFPSILNFFILQLFSWVALVVLPFLVFFSTPPLPASRIYSKVRTVIGAFAQPDLIVAVPGLPKTRSGKIMRRILRKVVAGEEDSLGDTSTLADPPVVDAIVAKVRGLQGR